MPVGLTPVSPLTTTGKRGIYYDNGNGGLFTKGVILDRLTATAVAQLDLAYKLPKNSRVIMCAIRTVTTGTQTTGTYFSFGVSGGDHDAFSVAQLFSNINTAGESMVVNRPAVSTTATDVYTTETTIALGCVDTNGAASGAWVADGVYDVAIWFETFAGWNAS